MALQVDMSRKNRREFFKKLGLKEFMLQVREHGKTQVQVVYADSEDSAIEFVREASSDADAAVVEVTTPKAVV